MTLTLIDSKTFNGSETSHTFSGLSSSYVAFLLFGELRSNRAAQILSGALIRFNGDATSGNYVFQRLIADGGTVAASAIIASQTGFFMDIPAANAPANEAASLVGEVVRPQSGFNKKLLYRTGLRRGTALTDLESYHNSGVWLSTAALTSISIVEQNSQNFTSGCGVDLFGLS